MKIKNHQITKEQFSTKWRQDYNNLLEDEHFEILFSNLLLVLDASFSMERQPYFKDEIIPDWKEITETIHQSMRDLEGEDLAQTESFVRLIEALPDRYLLLLLGQRLTSASITDRSGIPPLKSTLIESAFAPFNTQISVATRAWEKHAGRHSDNFWGEVKGSPSDKEEYVRNLIHQMLNQKTWWNVFFHYKHELVYEARVASGHGIRWAHGGTQLIGFLEPFINE
ncbi:hypothetical protein [Flammeovirga aprica]|uniref:Uncharacterized protein n=1 Tax=Flammeovirga aprica JL-4 TaxID=694437 RepID=A0A7X9RV16_9BACT|nr:hypothetical protein [Flammeovirga aprica]NME69245.1 hypothetical protein [Flammeovirga aprica JL-4]